MSTPPEKPRHSRKPALPRTTRPSASNPPEALVRLHRENRAPKSHAILGKILDTPSTSVVWQTLGKHVHCDQEWEELWREIAFALHLAGRPESTRTQQQRYFTNVAQRAAELRSLLTGGPLDLRIYDLLPPDILTLLYDRWIELKLLQDSIKQTPRKTRLRLDLQHWRNLASHERAELAHRLLPEWPATTEVLEQLEGLASELALDATRKARVSDRYTGAVPEFAQLMCGFFKAKYGRPFYRAVAAIAAAAFDAPDVDERVIEKALRRKS